MAPTNANRILDLLERQPGLDDDELSCQSGIRPRQQVNQICRRLEQQCRLERRPTANGKIGNFPVRATTVTITTQDEASNEAPRSSTRLSMATTPISARTEIELLRNTLIVLPCSGKKTQSAHAQISCLPITAALPATLGRRLEEARGAILDRGGLDESALLPAWQRYDGLLYRSAEQPLANAIASGLHVLIISGGYGIVRACEPIGTYSMRLKLAHWPKGLLQEVLAAYAARHGLQTVRAFVSRSTDYYRVVRQTSWRAAGVKDALAIAPEATRGAMVKAPRAQGEALGAFLAGRLDERWRSSDGLGLDVERI